MGDKAFRGAIVTVAAFLPVALAILVLFVRATDESPLPRSTYEVQAVVPDAVTLSRNAEVRIAGVQVGKVLDIRDRGSESLLLLEIGPDHGPLHRDATVDVRTRTLVGENYVELDPGTRRAGAVPSGGTLGRERAAGTVQVDDVLSTFDKPTRARFRRMIDALGRGLGGRAQAMNRLLGTTSSAVKQGAPVVRVLDRQRDQVASLVDDLGGAMRTFGDRKQEIRALARSSTSALSALSDRDEQLARVLRELPGALEQANGTASVLADLSSAATPVLRDLRLSIDELEPLMADLKPAARSTRGAVTSLDKFVAESPPLLRSLREASRSGVDALPSLRRLLAEYNPAADHINDYKAEIGSFFATGRSYTSAVDGDGHNLLRSNLVITPTSYGGFTPELARLYQGLRDVGALKQTLGSHGFNAYPSPGTNGDPRPFTGQYGRIEPERP